ncbi:hypothetical protein NKH77_05390 [Streptomyces sp. M19]
MQNLVSSDCSVEISGLEKRFRSRRGGAAGRGIEDVSFTVPRNSFFTLLGPAGAARRQRCAVWPDLRAPTAARSR